MSIFAHPLPTFHVHPFEAVAQRHVARIEERRKRAADRELLETVRRFSTGR